MFREVKKIIHRFCSSKGIFESVIISFIFTVFLLFTLHYSIRKWLRCFNEKKLFLQDFYVMLPLVLRSTVAQKSQQSDSKEACPCLLWNGIVYLSRIHPAPRMFRWAYVNNEKMFYCTYKMILNTNSKAGESSLISSDFNSNDGQKKNLTLRTKFYTGKTILENLFT